MRYENLRKQNTDFSCQEQICLFYVDKYYAGV